jgi:ATP-dependent Lon protease
MATAICSLVTGRPVSADVAMTGEVTLTGQVLPIGGLKEKTLAAQRAGITTVILPARNEIDLEDVPEHLRAGMKFVPVDRVEQVWRAAMGLRLNGGRARLADADRTGEAMAVAGEQSTSRRRKPPRPPATKAAPRTTKAVPPSKPVSARPETPPRGHPPKPAPPPKQTVSRKSADAKRGTAARGRSGRRK